MIYYSTITQCDYYFSFDNVNFIYEDLVRN